MTRPTSTAGRVRNLPPLILHPFSDSAGPDKLVESSRAHLMLQGLLPAGGLATAEIERRLLDGRYCEIRMLFYVGRDLERWIDQCLEQIARDEELQAAGVNAASFTHLLIDSPPRTVKEKLERWGVVDYKAIFQRALALNSMFTECPSRELLAPSFIRHYYRYADQIYQVRQASENFPYLDANGYDFELYASGEYSRMLEREWEEL
jgi:hypothetical protein